MVGEVWRLAAPSPVMRWTIDRQLLYPVLLVLLATTLATSVLTAYWFAWLFQRRDAQRLQQIVATLAAPGFPLTPAVLEKMSGLSGADFAVIDQRSEVLQTTLPLDTRDRAALAEWVRRDRAGETVVAEVVTGSGRHLVQQVEIREPYPGAGRRWLIVLSPVVQTWANWRAASLPPAIVGATSCLILVGLVAWRARQVVGPLRRLQRQAEAIAVGDFREIDLPGTNDEIRELSVSINQMGSQLARYEQQVRAQERLQTLGTIAGGMAHHLRNAATGGRLAVELHQLDCPCGSDDEYLTVAQRQFALMETYLQRMLLLGRGELPLANEPPGKVPLSEVVNKVVRLVGPVCQHAHIRLDTEDWDPEVSVPGSPDALEQIVANLVMNAIDAVKALPADRRRIRIELRWPGVNPAAEAAPAAAPHELLVRDWGSGPAPQLRSRLFEPFASDKPEGIGLGLAVVRQLAASQGCAVAWRREAETTCFAVQWTARLQGSIDVETARC